MEIIEVKKSTIEHLESQFRLESINDLINVAQCFEDCLQRHLGELLVNGIGRWVKGASYNIGYDRVEVEGATYLFRLGESTKEIGIMDVALVQIQPKLSLRQHKQMTVKLPGHGTFKKATICFPKQQSIDFELVSLITTTVFESGYSWFESKVTEVIRMSSNMLGQSLYNNLYPLIPDDKLRNSIWFGAGCKDACFFVIDSEPSKSALHILSKRRPLATNPYLLLSELLGANMSVDKTFASLAVKAGKCCDFDLSNAKYKEEMPLMAQAEMEVLGPKSISIFPITKQKSSYLVAVFPTPYKKDLLQILKTRRSELESIFLRSHSKLPKIINAIRSISNTPSIYGKTGEFVGGVLKSIISP